MRIDLSPSGGNDTPGFQAALDACGAAGGGVVHLAAEHYTIQPATITAGHALLMQHDNVSVRGAGIGLTMITFRLYDGSDPATHWPLVGGAVLRGNGIRIQGKTGTDYRRNIRLSGFTLDGGAPRTGNGSFPANPTTGDGFDLTHKGVDIEDRCWGVAIDEVEIKAWRGEITYYGGSELHEFSLRRSRLHDTNAGAMAVTAIGMLVEGNELYDCVQGGAEFAAQGGYARWVDNDIYNGRMGIGAYPATAQSVRGFVDIIGNRFRNCPAGALYLPGGSNTRVIDNLVVDCTTGIIFDARGVGGSGIDTIWGDNIEIARNRIVADAQSVDCGIFIGTNADHPTRNLHVHDNHAVVSVAGLAAGRTLRCGISYNGGAAVPTVLGLGSRIERNHVAGTQNQDNDSDAIGRDILLTDTNQRAIATLVTRQIPALARAVVVWRVRNAATALDISVDWRDAAGAIQSHVMAVGSQAIGMYGATFDIELTNANGYVGVSAKAGTANNVSVSAELSA